MWPSLSSTLRWSGSLLCCRPCYTYYEFVEITSTLGAMEGVDMVGYRGMKLSRLKRKSLNLVPYLVSMHL